ncbi:hypothetical protein HDA32_005740 [Spinactinospora alkalitolerans]|uniref:Uncharacterized protein n=1 Tax=Spinactinospora alkalitolerans TaxID=687207 RepID=A0A852U9J5_9ACTN|nr:hypothetical protein [Spinactinospora alkalitolerans]NYE50620.1 hypothetical protein [Spinactinospora alkalitolerans]
MPSPFRHAAVPMLLALALAGCGSGVELRPSARLDALLPPDDVYPDGYLVQTGDVAEIESEGSSSPDFDRVEPAECGAAMEESGSEQVPQGAAEGALQTARPDGASGPTTSYSFILVTEDPSEDASDTGPQVRMIDACSRFTGYVGDERMEGRIRRLSQDDLPEGSDGFIMEFSGGGTDMSTQMAWGKASDVHFALLSVHVDDGSSSPSVPELLDACRDEPREDGERPTTCYDNHRVQSEAIEELEREEEFAGIMASAARHLEEAA